MNKNETFHKFLELLRTADNFVIPIESFVQRLILAAILAFLLSRIYIKFGRSMSNRTSFASNFILLTVTTMIIITIVKSSLALSLGLVGALSIIRYRTAIKEPEELSYLFFSITIGLGLGADQVSITLISFIIVCIFIVIKNYSNQSKEIFTTLIITDNSGKLKLEECNQIIQNSCRNIELRRMDHKPDFLEIVYKIEMKEIKNLSLLVEKLKAVNEGISIQFLEI